MRHRAIRNLIYGCFLISGAAGLVYEVVWARHFSLFLGITTYAHTAVIAAYMIGLAAGGLVFGRIADRSARRLRLYAWLEIGVGLYAAATPWLFPWIQQAYAGAAGGLGVTGTGSHLGRFCLAFAVLLLPTFLMGGTLPVLVRGLTTSLPGFAKETGRLYGINTFGAALGTFAAGYLLLPSLGMLRTVYVGVFLNFAVAAIVLFIGRRDATAVSTASRVASDVAAADAGDRLSPASARILLVGFALSGLAALVYEIAWIRAITLVIGSSVYAFSLTLTTYLAGLAIGSILYARFLAGGGGVRAIAAGVRLRHAAFLEIGIAMSALLGLPLIGTLPSIFLSGYQSGLHESFALFQGFIFVLCFAVMIVPTIMLGALFPLLTTLWTRDAARMGRGVGVAYAANTAGTVLGALLGGLLFMPLLGVHTSLLLAAGLHTLIAASFWILRPDEPRGRFTAPAAALVLYGITATALPPWDRVLMTSGAFVNAEELADRRAGQSLREKAAEREIIYYAEGIDAIVCVEQTDEERILVINGKDDASSLSDLPTQILLGQLPLLFHPDPRTVMVIGLGSGITVGSTATHSSPRRIDVMEISREVVAASRLFAESHGDVLTDPRVRLIVADARNYLLAVDDAYDVITSEPSNPWISGVSNLFTREFFSLSRDRLAPGGVMAQWLETYNMAPGDVRTVWKTFASVFPHVSVWMPMPGDLILIGTMEQHAIDLARLSRALRETRIASDLERIGMDEPGRILATFLMDGERIARYSGGARINTDDRPWIEFQAPRNLYGSTAAANLIDVVEFLAAEPLAAPVTGIAMATRSGIDAPGLGLSVGCDAAIESGDLHADWLVQRSFIPAEGLPGPRVAVGTWRLLAWRESESETRAIADDRTTVPAREEMERGVRALLSGEPARSGSVAMSDGSPGIWMARAAVDGRIEIGLAWIAPAAPDRHRLHLAARIQTDPGADAWEGAARDLAARFRRLESPPGR